MTTARDFITLAFKEAGVLGVGQSLLNEDVNDGLTYLNRMLAQWQKKRWIVPSLYEIAAVGNNQQFNFIGPGQYYNAARPDKIQTAYFVQIGNGAGGGFSQGFSPGFDIGSSTQSGPVSFPLTQIWSWEDYARITLKQLNSWPQYFFYDGAFPNGRVYIWPIPSSAYEIHLVLKSPIGFTTQIENGVIEAQGFGYTDGNYGTVPLQNLTGFGAGATADITIVAGAITSFTIHDPGNGYNINDKLTVNNADVGGGAGQGFIWSITQVTDSLDAEFNMPDEYQEAVHYNLAIRLMSAYKVPPNSVTAGLAKLALNTIKLANTQVPTLQMPVSLSNRANRSFYIFNADIY